LISLVLILLFLQNNMDKSKASQNAIGKEKQMLFTPFIGTGMNFMGGGG